MILIKIHIFIVFYNSQSLSLMHICHCVSGCLHKHASTHTHKHKHTHTHTQTQTLKLQSLWSAVYFVDSSA